MAEAADETMLLDTLIDFRRGVCLIEASDYKGSYQGTGIHFGSGWIMSVGHNFQADDDSTSFHSLLSNAKFTFEDVREKDPERRVVTFNPKANRMAFIHHLTPGKEFDALNKDIAMIKLGVQSAYGGRTGEEWEKQEQSLLNKLNLPENFASLENDTPNINERVYSIHYGEGRPIKLSLHTVKSVTKTSGGIPIIEFNPTLPAGASGCPIINNEYKLGGLLIGGGDYGDPNAVDIALQWGDSIYPYVNEGVSIIAGVESHMLRLSDETQQQLQEQATENNLTIYLMNGEVING